MKKLLFLFFVAALPASAQIPADVMQEIDLRIKHQKNPSIVIGVFENNESYFYTKGLQNIATSMPAKTDSVYEIGSISKTFTGLLLAQLVNENKVNLDGAVQDYWPQPFVLVDNQKQPISLKQLSTHTSGLPRLPANLPAFSKDPYADYDRNKLLLGVKQAKPQKAGVNYAYSNFAVGLLGETLSLVTNQSFNTLVEQKILIPLNLKQTYMKLDDVPGAQLAQGYMGDVEAVAWQFDALAGAGSIRSSIIDLLAYGVAHLNPHESPLQKHIQLATTVHYHQDGLKVGLGWHVNPDGVIWHNGATAGFTSILMIDPKQRKVVAGITNHNSSIEDIAVHIMDPSKPMIERDYPVEIAVDQLDQFTGGFINKQSGKTLEIKLLNNKLFFTAPKQPRQALTYIGNNTFKFKLIKVKIEFYHDKEQGFSELKLMGWGDPQTYQKQL